jgi:class 3 adenylate cyclase
MGTIKAMKVPSNRSTNHTRGNGSMPYNRNRERKQLRDGKEGLAEKEISILKGALFRDKRRKITILFANIRSFTAVSERMADQEVIPTLNHYFIAMEDIVLRNSGLLCQHVRDQLMGGIRPRSSRSPWCLRCHLGGHGYAQHG